VRDKEKKESLRKYADQESKEKWSALINKTYNKGYTWDEFKRELLNNYLEASWLREEPQLEFGRL
jgi:hypothetical protein